MLKFEYNETKELINMPIKDISGMKFGKLTALEIRGKNKREYLWYCECDCGGNKVVPGSYLRTGHTTSCGCNIAERAKKARDVIHWTMELPRKHEKKMQES